MELPHLLDRGSSAGRISSIQKDLHKTVVFACRHGRNKLSLGLAAQHRGDVPARVAQYDHRTRIINDAQDHAQSAEGVGRLPDHTDLGAVDVRTLKNW